MSLTNRVTLFFLGVLGILLAAFSLTLYFAASSYLDRQTEERLRAAVGTLLAAVEIKPEALEWNSNERRFTLGTDESEDQVRWVVQDASGRLLAHSTNLRDGTDNILSQMRRLSAESPEGLVVGRFVDESGMPWDWNSRRLRAVSIAKSSGAIVGNTDPTTTHTTDEDNDNFSELSLTAALSLAPTQRTIRTLFLSSLAVSVLLWGLAALIGQQVCRRALSPLIAMSEAAKQISASDLDRRLPLPNTADELAELATSFNDLLGRVEDAYGRQQRFTAEASHQLRTPLAAMLGQVEVALRKPRSSKEYETSLQNVREQVVHLTQIVEVLLRLARSEGESDPLEFEKTELVDWIHLQQERWSHHPRSADLMISNSAPPIYVMTHTLLLSQLFDNLLDNASKYSEHGTPIVISLNTEGERATLEISDRGIGMTTDVHSHLFEPFYRSDDVRRLGMPGAGLGLSVAQQIARAIGVTITVSSEVGVGSVFTLIFP
jgi:two-component system, OmpR family, sensor kinase